MIHFALNHIRKYGPKLLTARENGLSLIQWATLAASPLLVTGVVLTWILYWVVLIKLLITAGAGISQIILWTLLAGNRDTNVWLVVITAVTDTLVTHNVFCIYTHFDCLVHAVVSLESKHSCTYPNNFNFFVKTFLYKRLFHFRWVFSHTLYLSVYLYTLQTPTRDIT